MLEPLSFQTQILDWYDDHGRKSLPWQQQNPYIVWISEIMLQQTQVDTVIPYFNRFMTLFPDIETLAKADLQVILKAWEGLGYYSRARNLHKAAQLILTSFRGQLPSDYEQLQSLPGIGPYCGAAIASIAFEKPIPVVDGNVLRVFSRFWGLSDDIRSGKARQSIFNKFNRSIDMSTHRISCSINRSWIWNSHNISIFSNTLKLPHNRPFKSSVGFGRA